MTLKQFFLIFIFALAISACQQKYDPPAVTTDYSLLVVDGFLNNSADTSILTLSRTKKIQDGIDRNGETGAAVSVEDEGGNPLYYFQERDNGNYILPGIVLNENQGYRLRILTKDGSTFLSDVIKAKITPAIDSVSWEKTGNGVMLYANTHDSDDDTKYYRWDYTETWEFLSNYYSGVVYENGIIRQRNPDEYVFDCWSTKNSTGLLLGTSAKLSQDIISKSPLRTIPYNSIELSVKYSMLLRQYALTKEGFDYFQNLKKITEQLGSIFDAQPSQLTGNIHCVDRPAEVVLGFVSASSLQTKRIFIPHAAVLPWNYNYYCDPQKLVPSDSFDYYFGNGGAVPTDVIRGPPRGDIIAAHGGSVYCVDCRSRGGSTIRPDFWQ